MERTLHWSSRASSDTVSFTFTYHTLQFIIIIFTIFKVIQDHRFWFQSKARVWFPVHSLAHLWTEPNFSCAHVVLQAPLQRASRARVAVSDAVRRRRSSRRCRHVPARHHFRRCSSPRRRLRLASLDLFAPVSRTQSISQCLLTAGVNAVEHRLLFCRLC